MDKLVDLWAQVEWSKLPVMVASYPSNVHEMNPLLEASMESLQIDLLQICEDVSQKVIVEDHEKAKAYSPGPVSDLCVMGIFSLQLMTFSGLLKEKSVERKEVPMMLEKNVGSFMNVLKRYVSPDPTNLYADFGSNRRPEDLDISDLAIQFLGRTLYQLADLPPPPGPQLVEEQFAFGRNWRQFVDRISVNGLISSVKEVRGLVGGAISNLHGLTVLDLGCGSGLSSLSFRLLGANVISVDVQEESLEASKHLQMRFKSVLWNESEDSTWQFVKASALDAWALAAMKPADIVHTWGVLHHTGDVWQAIHNAQLPLAEDGLLLVAVYAEEFYDEKESILMMKDFYRKANLKQQEHLDIAVGIYWLRPLLRAGKNPFEVLQNFSQMRGMDFWTDVRDWLGGWPTEFVSTSAMLSFVKHTGLRCVHVRRNGGNTEFAFTRPAGVKKWTAGRICEDLEFQEDFTKTLPLLQQSLYHWPHEMELMRRWWFSRLPDWMRNYSDGNDNPQKDRLLLIRKSGEPFGYPSAQFARPDSIRDLRLSLYAFWEGFAYISPGNPDDWIGDSIPKGVPFRVKGDTKKLQACLLPLAEVSLQEEAQIQVLATDAGLT